MTNLTAIPPPFLAHAHPLLRYLLTAACAVGGGLLIWYIISITTGPIIHSQLGFPTEAEWDAKFTTVAYALSFFFGGNLAARTPFAYLPARAAFIGCLIFIATSWLIPYPYLTHPELFTSSFPLLTAPIGAAIARRNSKQKPPQPLPAHT